MRSPRQGTLRVAFVINDLLLGGAQAAVLGIASNLDRARFEPVVYYLNAYPEERPSMEGRFREAGIRHVYIGTGGKTPITGSFLRLRSLWKSDRPALAHLHLPDAVIAGALASLSLGIPFIMHEQQTHHMHSAKIRLAYRILRSWATLTICYSPVIEREIFGDASVLASAPARLERRSYSIYNGIDIRKAEAVRATLDRTEKRQELGLPTDSYVITSVARLIRWKGHETLLEAFAKIADTIPAAHLCLVGEGVLRDPLAARAAELGLAGRVHLLGARNDIYEILAASDVGSLALTYEGGMSGESIGIAGFEMMGLGLPLIASDYPSARAYVVDGETALLVPPGDVPALSSALTSLFHDAPKREALGKSGAAFVRGNLDWRALVPIYEEIYLRSVRS